MRNCASEACAARALMCNCTSENPYSRSWLWIPGPRQAARPGMTEPFVDPSLRGALATKQSILSLRRGMDCFASLAMTEEHQPGYSLRHGRACPGHLRP